MNIQTTTYSAIILTTLLSTLIYVSISSTLANTESGTDISLSAVMTDDVDTAKPGDTLTYSIVLTNTSSEDASVTISNQLPKYLIPVATSPDAQADSASRTITWEQIAIPASQEITIGLRAQVENNVPENHVIENKADITGSNVQLTVTDRTQIKAPQSTPTPAAPIQPTATTGPSDVLIIPLLMAIIIGFIGIRKNFAKTA